MKIDVDYYYTQKFLPTKTKPVFCVLPWQWRHQRMLEPYVS